MSLNKIVFIFTLLLLASTISLEASNVFKIDSLLYAKKSFPEDGYDLYKVNIKKAYDYFNNGADFFFKKGDTTNYITCMLGVSDLKKRQGFFNSSFDIIYKLQSDYSKNINPTVNTDIHKKLGILYGFFGKDSLALHHLNKALQLGKSHKYVRGLQSLYFQFAEQNIQMKNYDNAIKYLDSCYITSENNNRLIYVDANYVLAFTRKKELQKAKIYLRGLVDAFEKGNKGFLAKIYAFNAEYKQALKEQDSAIFYYKKSLEMVNNSQVHMEIKPRILEELANLYDQKNDKNSAYKYIKLSKNISDSLFHTQSNQNKELFEIKNKYQTDLTLKNNQLIAQKSLLDLNNKANFRLKLLIGILIFTGIILVIVFKLRTKMNKMRYAQSLKEQKNEAILQRKNKELTANALQFIEKENAFKELLEIIKTTSPEKYKSLVMNYNKSNKQIWEDFNLRFTQTNNKFYKKISDLHPSLTQNDLKQCALIKLNFDSKEMSQILGISLHSVHMARSRIRKKLGLKREQSLGKYISNI